MSGVAAGASASYERRAERAQLREAPVVPDREHGARERLRRDRRLDHALGLGEAAPRGTRPPRASTARSVIACAGICSPWPLAYSPGSDTGSRPVVAYSPKSAAIAARWLVSAQPYEQT